MYRVMLFVSLTIDVDNSNNFICTYVFFLNESILPHAAHYTAYNKHSHEHTHTNTHTRRQKLIHTRDVIAPKQVEDK